MTKAEKKRWHGIARELEDKARRVLDGGYGPDTEPGESDAWAADLFSAAAKIHKGEQKLLTHQEREEIDSL